MAPMHLRVATEADALPIARLHTESWRSAYREMLSAAYLERAIEADRQALWQRRFADPAPNQRVIVAEQGGALCGFLCLYAADDPTWGTLIDNLHVPPALKGQGIGRRLMREAFSWCAQHCPEPGIYLWVLRQNVPAQGFYRRLGAQNAGVDTLPGPDGGTLPVYRFHWPQTVQFPS